MTRVGPLGRTISPIDFAMSLLKAVATFTTRDTVHRVTAGLKKSP